MCGIAGILRVHRPDGPIPPHHEAIPEAWLDILDESIKHRGPDGAGRFRDRATRPDGTVVDVAFVHRRLSIIDHADGAQPMVHVRYADGSGEQLRPQRFLEDRIGGRPEGIGILDLTGETHEVPERVRSATDIVAVAFNGCIYTHRELRAELEALGHRFETDHSDTEVLVHGHRAWGLRIVDELDGMYAAVVWNRKTGQVAWGQDLAGEKPLYQAATNPSDARVWSTSPAGLGFFGATMSPGMSLIQLPGIEDWLKGGSDWIPPIVSYAQSQGEWSICPEHPRQGATPRDPRYASSPVRSISYHRRLVSRAQRPGRHLGQQEHAGYLLDRAITSRLEADVALGVFLSGGLDSALIAAIAHKSRPDIRAFTVRMPHPDYDESEQAAATAAAIGIEHTILDCQPNPATDLMHLIEQLGLPFGDSSLLPTYWVSRAARDHIKVALSGDGGDELFGGYRRHTINTTLNRWHRVLRFIPDRLLDQRDPKSRSSYLARLAVAARYGGYNELLSIFPTPDLRHLASIRDEEPLGDDKFRPIDDPLRHDFLHYLPNDLLRKTDTASMAVGLEVRAPFLARELVEAAMRTPLEVLMPRGERKGLLKQVARKYLPPEIVDHPKQGFAIPIGEWFRTDYGSMRQLLYDHLESTDPFPGLADAGVEINMGFVRRMLREHDAAGERSINPWHGRDHSQRLYMLLVLSVWAKWLGGVRS